MHDAQQVTPSEAVLLWPETHPMWAPETARRQARHMPWAHSRALLSTAFLAVERDGALMLELTREKRFRGHDEYVVAAARSGVGRWPDPSLEGWLHREVQAGTRPIAELVVGWLEGEKAWNPAQDALARTRGNLLRRRAMFETGRRWFRRGYEPRAGLEYGFPVRVDILVRDIFTERRDVWDRLNKDIEEAFTRRSSGGGDGGLGFDFDFGGGD